MKKIILRLAFVFVIALIVLDVSSVKVFGKDEKKQYQPLQQTDSNMGRNGFSMNLLKRIF